MRNLLEPDKLRFLEATATYAVGPVLSTVAEMYFAVVWLPIYISMYCLICGLRLSLLVTCLPRL